MTETTIEKSSSVEELLQLVICHLSNEEFGVEIAKVKEIIRIPGITKIPHVPEYIEGVINLRGTIIPIINLATRFNLIHKEISEDSRIMVLEIGNTVAGMVVDAVTEVLRISTESIEAAPEAIASKATEKYIHGIGKIDGRLLILLDIERIFNEEQKAQIGRLESAGPIPA